MRVLSVLIAVSLHLFTTPAKALDNSRRISKTGVIFQKTDAYPELGEAYSDPTGLIWGSLIPASSAPQGLTPQAAAEACKRIGARLPTIEEFDQFARYLGADSPMGYDPHSVTDKKDLLPELSGNSFWSSSGNESNHVNDAFTGESGMLFYIIWSEETTFTMSARCVRKDDLVAYLGDLLLEKMPSRFAEARASSRLN